MFVETASALLDEDPLAAVVLAEISADMFGKAAARHPDRVLNVGIREQLMVSVGGGLALTGMRPIVHTYAPFLVERAYEQVKLDLGHQGVHAVLVSIGASYDAARPAGRTRRRRTWRCWTACQGSPWSCRGTRPRWRRCCAGPWVRWTLALLICGCRPRPTAEARPVSASLQVVRPGRRAVVVAVGPMLSPVLEAVADLDVTVAYATTVRPFDAAGLRALEARRGPWCWSSRTWPGRPLCRGVRAGLAAAPAAEPGRAAGELRRYGTPAEHAALLTGWTRPGSGAR